jgi:NADP-dependent 3-hydroxy acid dehydrogenase YdfG
MKQEMTMIIPYLVIPILVENKAGKIVVFGSSRGLDYYIEEYEAGRWPDMPRLSDFQ